MRFKIGDWVRSRIRPDLPMKVRSVSADGLGFSPLENPTLSGEWFPDAYLIRGTWELAPPPVGERSGRVHCLPNPVNDIGESWYACPCKFPSFDPSLWCPCTPEPKASLPTVGLAVTGAHAGEMVDIVGGVERPRSEPKETPDYGTCRCGIGLHAAEDYIRHTMLHGERPTIKTVFGAAQAVPNLCHCPLDMIMAGRHLEGCGRK